MGVDLNVRTFVRGDRDGSARSRLILGQRAETKRQHSRSQYVADLPAGNLESAWMIFAFLGPDELTLAREHELIEGGELI